MRNDRAVRLRIDRFWSIYQSAYEHLLHLLHAYVGQEAQWWSRAKAYTNDPISPQMWGLMKVAGKRLYQLEPDQMDYLWSKTDPKDRRILSPFSPQEIEHFNHYGTVTPVSTSVFFSSIKQAGQWLDTWVNHHNQQLRSQGLGEEQELGRRWGGQRRVVGAIVLDSSLKLLAQQLNQPNLGSTAHAECLVYDHLCRQAVWPEINELILISSLKPCKMCAGLWVGESKLTQLHVRYLQDDPGPNGQNTAFDKGSYAWKEAKKWPYSVQSVNQSMLILN